MQTSKIRICAIATISKSMDWFMIASLRNLAQNGFDVTLICDMDETFIAQNSDFATCIPVKMRRGAKIGDLFRVTCEMKKIFRREKFDVIYYMTPNASFYASIAGKRVGIKHRIYSQCGLRYVSFGGIKRKIFKWIEKLTCKNSTAVRAQSPLNMAFALSEGLCKPEKISVVGIGGTVGVDLSLCDSFNHTEKNKEIRAKYGIPEDAFIYGFVGRLNADKGVNELIKAFEKTSKQIDNAYLLLVGMYDEGNPISEENLKIANESPRIILTGDVENEAVYFHMAAFDVLVHPTYREGFGKVLQEGLGMSLPIITTDVPGPKEVIEDGVTGALVPVKNADALADKMIEICQNPALRQQYATAGRKRAETYFDRPIMLNNILEDMKKIVGAAND